MSKNSRKDYILELALSLVIRAALDYWISGSRRALDFLVVLKNFRDGDWVKGVINLLYAIGCLITLGALTFGKDAVGQATKEAVAYAAKKIAPSAERRATNEVGTELVSRDEAVEAEYSEGIEVTKCVSMIAIDGCTVIKKSISVILRAPHLAVAERRQQYLVWRRN